MPKVKKLTPAMLRKLVLEEKARIEEEKAVSASDELDAPKPDEVDADEYADTLEKDINHLAVLKIKEAKARNSLKKIQAVQAKLTKRIVESRS